MMMTPSQRVKRAIELFDKQGLYPRGCSDFVCDVLEIRWEDANSLLSLKSGDAPISDFSKIGIGSIIGWANDSGSGHVAVYVNLKDAKFIDVQSPGQNAKPRKLNSYGSQKLYLSNKYGF